MKKWLCLFVLISFPAFAISDAEIKQRIIQESRASYSGACGCPYDRMKNGRKCGKNSAYIKTGGASLYCYESDVSASEIEYSRRKHK